ncbi:MAG: hypothetical protein DLM55_04480 [Acidimicrobiales bacterium]|nr:MAG: hypothetical protein DLM55_04480 [Acidimicrobiales bacterium]
MTRVEAGGKGVRIHDLRHACATFLLAAGALSRGDGRAGHSQIGLTMKYYTHVLGELRQDAAIGMNRMFFSE